MKKFNVNEHIYIQITKAGWKELSSSYSEEYIERHIESNKVVIDGEDWYRIQCYGAFEMLPLSFGAEPYFKTTIMIDDESLIDYNETQSRTIL